MLGVVGVLMISCWIGLGSFGILWLVGLMDVDKIWISSLLGLDIVGVGIDVEMERLVFNVGEVLV